MRRGRLLAMGADPFQQAWEPNVGRWCGVAVALWLAVALWGGGGRAEAGMNETLDAAAKREEQGDFRGAERLLEDALASRDAEASVDARRRLELERERLRRIRRDYSLTRGELEDALKAAVRDFETADLEGWLKEGLFDARPIDGETRFFVSSVSNLFFRRPELSVRRLRQRDASALQRAYWENARAIRASAREGGTSWVLPKRLRVRMTVRVRPGSVAEGEKVVAWLPVPRRFPHQEEFQLGKVFPGLAQVAPDESPIRSLYLEGVGAADGSARFEIDYSYVAKGVCFDLSAREGKPSVGNPLSAEVERYLRPGPHVEFTDAMRRMAEELGVGEVDSVRRARRYYEWISRQVRYSYAPEYSTVRNLGEACRSQGRGDCGQAAFLLMTLCRISGIPARWQSGWSLFPGDETIHDWCELYFEPWGWVPVDPYMGMYATQYATTLSPDQRAELRDFYFGGLTQYRMAANADHGQTLWPSKRSIRSDEVDFQRGEVEAAGRNLFFDRFQYDLTWEEISKP